MNLQHLAGLPLYLRSQRAEGQKKIPVVRTNPVGDNAQNVPCGDQSPRHLPEIITFPAPQ